MCTSDNTRQTKQSNAEKLKDVLFPIGTIVAADMEDEIIQVMIIGTRAHNFDSKNTWDYICVPFPEGYKATKNETGYSNIVYFNHFDIYTETGRIIDELVNIIDELASIMDKIVSVIGNCTEAESIIDQIVGIINKIFESAKREIQNDAKE